MNDSSGGFEMALFDTLPEKLFLPLSSANRRFSADLLLSLHEKTFGLAAEPPKRSDVIDEIEDFMRRWENVHGVADDDDDVGSPPSNRARKTYARMVETGWLIEHKDRYVRYVDIDPDAAGLLHVLAQIARGETRTYGGAVVGVLAALQSAAANPSELSENLRNAIIAARDFLSHMRMVSVSLRKVEDRIIQQDTLREVFRSFFTDFVEKHLIADFKTLHTKHNPFRFRSRIIKQARDMSSSPLTVMALGEAYHREGRAPSAAMGQVSVLDDLALVIQIFESTEAHLAAIDATVSRIERRITATARYMDRLGRTAEASLIDAMKLVAARHETDVPVASALTAEGFPVGPPHVPAPRRERMPIPPSTIRKLEKDPAFAAFLEAKSDYLRRTKVTPTGVLGYLDRMLADRTAVTGSDMRIETVDDFLVFQRLREIPTLFDGNVARRYELEVLPGRIANGWIECQDFVVRRKGRR